MVLRNSYLSPVQLWDKCMIGLNFLNINNSDYLSIPQQFLVVIQPIIKGFHQCSYGTGFVSARIDRIKWINIIAVQAVGTLMTVNNHSL